jgi:hypothetical protein
MLRLLSGPPVVRYKHSRPGEIIPWALKKRGRIEVVDHSIIGDRFQHKRWAGWE